MSEVGVKLVSDLRLLTSAMDDFNDLNDFKLFNDFHKLKVVTICLIDF